MVLHNVAPIGTVLHSVAQCCVFRCNLPTVHGILLLDAFQRNYTMKVWTNATARSLNQRENHKNLQYTCTLEYYAFCATGRSATAAASLSFISLRIMPFE